MPSKQGGVKACFVWALATPQQLEGLGSHTEWGAGDGEPYNLHSRERPGEDEPGRDRRPEASATARAGDEAQGCEGGSAPPAGLPCAKGPWRGALLGRRALLLLVVVGIQGRV